VLGLLWIVIQPLILLAVYSLVFLGVFTRPGDVTGQSEFVLGMFLGILIYSFFAESVTRAPQLVLANPSYVKRVVFPLEVLPLSVILALGLNLLIGLALLLLADLLFLGGVPLTSLWLPLLLVPLFLMTLGASWLLASLGVFLRDIPQIVRALTLVLMFLTPIFWEIEQAKALEPWIYLNPLTCIVVPAKQALVQGATPDLSLLGGVTAFFSTLCAGRSRVVCSDPKRLCGCPLMACWAMREGQQ
jgi:lipopolysaccharide transport system permease protein